MKIRNTGWIMSAALLGLILAGGFQGGGGDKVGVVDMGRIINSSEFYSKQREKLKKMSDARMGVLQFASTYPVFTPEQAATFRTLSTKETLTAAEKTTLEGIK